MSPTDPTARWRELLDGLGDPDALRPLVRDNDPATLDQLTLGLRLVGEALTRAAMTHPLTAGLDVELVRRHPADPPGGGVTGRPAQQTIMVHDDEPGAAGAVDAGGPTQRDEETGT